MMWVKRLLLLSGVIALLAGVLWQFEAVRNAVAPLRVVHVGLFHQPQNRLRFKIEVAANRSCNAYLKYWQPGSDDTLFSAMSAGKSRHALWITRAKGNTGYRFQVVVRTPGQVARSKTYPLATRAMYQATPYFTLEKVDSSFAPELKGKFFLTQILTEPGSAVILDNKGEVVWYESFSKGVKVAHWTPDRTVLCIVGSEKIPSSGGDEIIELDLAGNMVTHLKAGVGEMDKLVHHEVRTDRSGNIYALTFDKKVFDLSSVGGKAQDTVKADGIVVFSRQGKKLWEWSVLDHLDPLRDPDILKNKKDWVHANSVFRDEDENFLISFRDLNQVWKIDAKTGAVLWTLGENGDFPLDNQHLFSAQHAAHITANGELMLLDNGVRKGISRALSFRLNDSAKKARVGLTVPLDSAYFSSVKGNVQQFGQDKLLFCVTDPRQLLVTDKCGSVLWKIQVGGDPYRIEETPGFEQQNPEIQL